MRTFLITYLLTAFSAFAAGPYYVDYSAGSDSANGLSTSTAWKHLPGDPSASGNSDGVRSLTGTIYLKGGVVYALASTAGITIDSTRFNPLGPLTVTSGADVGWGTGLATIDGAGVAYWLVLSSGMTNVTFSRLEIRNSIGVTGTFDGPGLKLYGSVSNVVNGCSVHDIGTNNASCHADAIEIGYNTQSPYYRSYHTITNCTLYNSTQKAVDIYGANGNTVANNFIWNHRDHGVCFTASDNRIYGNIISNVSANVWLTAHTDPGYGIKFSVGTPCPCTNNLAYNNVIAHGKYGSIVIDNRQNAGGYNGDNNKIFNNTVIDGDLVNGYHIIYVDSTYGPINGTMLLNNIVCSEAAAGSTGSGIITPVGFDFPGAGTPLGNNNLIAYNLFFGQNATIHPGFEIAGVDHSPTWANFADSGSTSPDYRFKVAANGTGNSFDYASQLFDTNPKFTSYPGDLTLQATSPARGVATNLSAYFTTDIKGNTRTTWSMGAYEYVGATDPSISVQPQNQTVTAPNSATFSVTASGNSALSYQWNWYGTNVTGATASSWTTPATVTANTGSSVYVTVTDTASSLQSATATLTVNALLPLGNGTATTLKVRTMHIGGAP